MDENLEYIIVDIETTGLDLKNSSIIEVGALLVRDGVIKDRFSSLIKYDGKLSETIKRVTGINEQMLENAPEVDQVINNLKKFINKRPVVAHNGFHFDFPMLERHGLKIAEKYDSMEFAFLQIAEPSREAVERYRQFNQEVTEEAERINTKFSQGSWKPIVLIKRHFSHEELYPLYRKADVCMVTSLHDGMNLVSKEFVAARNDEAGVLILSKFAGSSKELKGAIIINPYSAEQTALAINDALNMPMIQQRRRMQKMREAVRDYNIYRWAAEFMRAIINLD